jgi:hypothetical protein
MREELVRVVPRLVYADPRYRLETVKDEFDVAVEGVIEKVVESRTGSAAESWLEKIWSM